MSNRTASRREYVAGHGPSSSAAPAALGRGNSDAGPRGLGTGYRHVGGGSARVWRWTERFVRAAGGRGRQGQGDAMTGGEDHRQAAGEADVRPDAGEAVDGAPPEGSVLLRHKAGLPAAIEGYVERPELEARCALTEHPLTVLHAPGGFGKTALLAQRCRALRERGIAVAWLVLDEEDGPGSVAADLALAFEQAGLATFGPAGGRSEGGAAQAPDPQADSQAEYRIELLIRAIARHGAPCVLVLDEVERLQRPETVAALNTLLGRAPDNLHVGMAFREPPPGLEIAMFALEGRGVTVTAEELRFSKPDIARFFEQKLSRRELNTVAADSAGWPLALRIHRNAVRHGAPGAAGGDHAVAGWIETRLWRGIAGADRDFLLDIALFDPLDPELIDEVTGTGNAARRIASMGALAGLLSTTGGGGSAMRLHPLVRDYCEKRRFEEDVERYRTVHRGIAVALARRGRAVEALRHAAEAGEPELLGRIAEGTGGVRLWLEQGLEVLRTVDGLLPLDVVSKHPRLALMRCVVLISSGDMEEAKRVYGAAAVETAGFTRDREGGDDRALRTEHIFVQGMLHMCGCVAYGEGIMGVIAGAQAVADGADTDPLLRGLFSLGMCIAHNQRTMFDPAIEWAGRARAGLARGSPYLAHVDFQAGSVAMARGRTREARECYERALKVARASHLRDAGAVMIGEALAAELELECSAGLPRAGGPRVSPRLLGECCAWLDIYAASIAVEAELALVRAGPQAALTLVEDAREYALRTERPALARFLSALRVSVLVEGGEVEEAERAWRFDRLPEGAGECVDLETQSWREAEMLACARLRLLIARDEFEAARDLAAALDAVAAERSLVRTRMRGLALSAVLEHRAGEDGRARAHAVDYLRLYIEADYAWPLARERAVALSLLDDIAGGPGGDGAVVEAAAGLREAMRDNADAVEEPSRWALNGRRAGGPDADGGAFGPGDRRGSEAEPRRGALAHARHLREARRTHAARCGAPRAGAGDPAAGRGGAAGEVVARTRRAAGGERAQSF